MMRNQPHTLARLIPKTPIRHLYELLRDYPKEELHLGVAREFCRKPEPLATMIVESRRFSELYINEEEGFHNRGNDGTLTIARQNSKKLADKLLQQIALKKEVGIASSIVHNFDYVDYDISPFRTTGSYFENGDSGDSSGTGGMDILLRNQNDRTPIVGEVKADTDVNPVFGLIQSLMYAVELSTPSQRRRLNQAYGYRFAEDSTIPGVDIYLFLLRYGQDSISEEFLRLANQLSAALLKDKNLSPIVRRIVALKTEMPNDTLEGFTLAFDHRV